MVGIYENSDYTNALGQKKKILRIFLITLCVLIAVDIAAFVFYVFQEFETPYKTPILLFDLLTCAAFVIVFYPIMAIKYKRVNDYCKMLADFGGGIKVEGTNTFVRVDGSVTSKDGVDFISLVFLEWSEKKQEYFERNILFDIEKPVPDFKKGDVVHHVTQGNVLLAYELRREDIFE